MFIETIPNRGSPPAVLLREAYRDEHGRAQKRTLANLSKLPGDLIGGLKALLKGGALTGYHWGITRKQAMLGWEAGQVGLH